MGDRINIGPNTLVSQVEGLVCSDMDGETVLLSVESGNYFGMDSIGSRIWGLIEEPRPVSRLCQALIEEYDVEPSQCERDVIAYLTQLAKEGLIRVSDGEMG